MQTQARPPRSRRSDDLFAVLEDGDGLGGAALRGEDDLLLGCAVRIGDDRDAVVVEVEHAGRPERAVPGAHADLAVDPNLEHALTLSSRSPTGRPAELIEF